jgi:uncharacterized protein YbbK (DUF523 family)
MTDRQYLKNLIEPTQDDSLRVLFSACLLGILCGADGSSYGNHPKILKLKDFAHVEVTSFCPEDFAFGTPRGIPDIEGGSGSDMLSGNARVITETGKDVTEKMIIAAKKMLQLAIDKKIELAILMDVSVACGSQEIYLGHRLSPTPVYQTEMGVHSRWKTHNRGDISPGFFDLCNCDRRDTIGCSHPGIHLI